MGRGVPMHEGPMLELKREWSDGIKKTIVAFANSEGGTLLVGVDDDGQVVGVEDCDQCIVRVMQAAGNAIKPDVTMFVHAEVEEREGKPLVRIEVRRGTARPYYLAEKGIRPEGVYVRHGALSAPASEAAILAMIKEAAGDSYENERSLVQELTFETAERAFCDGGMPLEAQHMRTLGLTDEDGLFTNLALLLSDQCAATVKAAVFQGTTKTTFLDRFEFEGSLFRQFEEVLRFVDRYNATRSEIGSDLRRVDARDYPEVAVREALLNMFVHREYAIPGPALVSVFDDRVEFLNIGGLRPGITENDMRTGVSVSRNPRLANVLYRLKWVEAYGTGVQKIMGSYAGSEHTPSFEVSDNALKVTLPSMREDRHAPEADRFSAPGPFFGTSPSSPDPAISRVEYAVVQLAKERGEITRKDVENELGTSQSAAIRLLSRLQERGLLSRVGKGKNTVYLA